MTALAMFVTATTQMAIPRKTDFLLIGGIMSVFAGAPLAAGVAAEEQVMVENSTVALESSNG